MNSFKDAFKKFSDSTEKDLEKAKQKYGRAILDVIQKVDKDQSELDFVNDVTYELAEQYGYDLSELDPDESFILISSYK